MKHQWLVHEAKKWVGTMEAGGENRGDVVDHFITSTGGAIGSPWCVSFVRYCVDQVDKQCELIFVTSEEMRQPNILPKTHSVLKLWKNCPEQSKLMTPIPGSIVCWEHFNQAGHATGLGHCGIVTSAVDHGDWIKVVEGNTSSGGVDIDRNGDGVFSKMRSTQGGLRFRVLGFISPWPNLSK